MQYSIILAHVLKCWLYLHKIVFIKIMNLLFDKLSIQVVEQLRLFFVPPHFFYNFFFPICFYVGRLCARSKLK